MIKVGFATGADFPELGPNEIKMLPLLAKEDIDATPIYWNDANTDFNAFDFIIIRSCWDYHIQPKKFIKWLEYLAANNIKVLNTVEQILDNINKEYLKALAQKGIPIVPTIWMQNPTSQAIKKHMTENRWTKAVLKPTVSASAFETYLFDQHDDLSFLKTVKSSNFMLQPFLEEIKAPGEYSLIFFNKNYSHVVIKKPGENDFRVQQELGGSTQSISIGNQYIRQAQNIVDQLPDPVLYARVDGVIRNDQFTLMELELIEPELYLSKEKHITNFANAILNVIKNFR